jgi:ATP-dependent RNA helicase DeaD
VSGDSQSISFRDLSLSEPILRALTDVGYETPSPIQAATIPALLTGQDVLGQAQTGTGKTAAFALPLLSNLAMAQRAPQALILVPTRELAIQVAEAFARYAAHLEGFRVLPIYGGQSYQPQLQALKRGVHVIVGTPGRVMDHMKRGTLDLSELRYLVLDEADEMLRMGFIDDVEWVLEQIPAERQIALFSATMPTAVRRIAQKYLRSPAEVTIKSKTTTATNIRQRYWVVSGGANKLEALTRILEAEPFDAMLIFMRTKQSTVELAERLAARGFAADALNGDIAQAHRERTIARLKSGQLDIVVATDVAARGLDVDRISHVVNFDVPYDSESYVHRIGRTGRAGRSGEAILFLAPRERNMLRTIERATRQPIDRMELPTIADVNEQRRTRFNDRITAALASGEATRYQGLIERYESEHNVPTIEIAAALASLLQGKAPLFLTESAPRPAPTSEPRRENAFGGEREQSSRHEAPRFEAHRHESPRYESPRQESSGPRKERRDDRPQQKFERPRPAAAPAFEPAADRNVAEFAQYAERRAPKRRTSPDVEMETYRIEVGHVHGALPGNIMGAIANEAGLDGEFIGRIDIRHDHSFVDLPVGMPKDVFHDLKKARVAGQMLQIGKARKTHSPKPDFSRPDFAKPDFPKPDFSQDAPPRKRKSRG